MKRLPISLFLALVLFVSGGCAAPRVDPAPEEVVVAATMLPTTVFALNLLQGVPGVTVRALSQPETGCLHDYQLQPDDLRLLSQADLLLLNGAGMEASFLDRIFQQYPDLPQVDSSTGVQLLASSVAHEHGSEHEHESHEPPHEHEQNGHIWMSVGNAMQQVRNIAEALCALLPGDAAAIRSNEAAYLARLETLQSDMRAATAPLSGAAIVTYHDAFAYLADEQGLRVAATLVADPEDTPSTRAVASLVDEIRSEGLQVVFTEPGASTQSAGTLARETGIRIASLDPITRGEATLDAYETRQRANLRTLQEVFAP